MNELFLPNSDSGFFGILAHWLGIGFIISLVLGLPSIAGWALLLFFPAIIMMMIFDLPLLVFFVFISVYIIIAEG